MIFFFNHQIEQWLVHCYMCSYLELWFINKIKKNWTLIFEKKKYTNLLYQYPVSFMKIKIKDFSCKTAFLFLCFRTEKKREIKWRDNKGLQYPPVCWKEEVVKWVCLIKDLCETMIQYTKHEGIISFKGTASWRCIYEKWWKGLKTQAWRLFSEIAGLFLDLQVATLLWQKVEFQTISLC